MRGKGGEDGEPWPASVGGDVGAIIRKNRGKVRINQYYYGDLERYRNMSVTELREARALLHRQRRAASRAFLHHPAVALFFAAICGFVGVLVYQFGRKPTMESFIMVMVGVMAVLLASVFMSSQRQPLVDGLKMLKADLKFVEAFLAIHEAEEAVEHKSTLHAQFD